MNRLVFLVVVAAACAKSDRAKPEPKETAAAIAVTAPNFELLCESSDAKSSSTLFCMRHDTRTGDVKRVFWDHLPSTQGSTKALEGPPGRYKLSCQATRNETSSDVFCLRLNTESGEMMLIGLSKVGGLPEDIPPHQHAPSQPPH